MLCVCMYETIDKTWVCRPCLKLRFVLCQVCNVCMLPLYWLGFVMIIPPPVDNGSPFWILKIFDVVMGVSLVHMNTCSHMHYTRVSQSIEYYQCNRIPIIIHSLSFVFSIYRHHVSTNVDIYVCTYEHIFIC